LDDFEVGVLDVQRRAPDDRTNRTAFVEQRSNQMTSEEPRSAGDQANADVVEWRWT